MPAFHDCIRSAQRQGALSSDEADSLIERYEQHRQARAAAGAPDPEAQAKAALLSEKQMEAATRTAIANGQAAAQQRIRYFVENYRDLDGKSSPFEAFAALLESKASGTSSIRYNAEARAFMAHAEVADFISEFQRTFLLGRRPNKPQVDNIVREMRGEGTGSPEAKAMAQGFTDAFEHLREDFNKAAGFEAIGKLDYGFLPQHHDPAALLGAPGKAADDKFKFWYERELPRLDLDRMKDPLTGGPLTPERLAAGMRAAWDHIVSGGWSDRKSGEAGFGNGALAKQRSDHRFIHYKSADDWLASNREFGSGDPTKAMFEHIRGMAHDIETMKMLGPNPDATAAWFGEVVQSEAGKAITGQPSLHAGTPGVDTGKKQAARLEAIYSAIRGQEVISGRLASGFADVSNTLTAAYLGSTSLLAATTDPFIDRAARQLNGLPQAKAMWGLIDAMHQGQTREQMLRAGIGLDDFLHVMGNEARYAGILGGHQWSKWLADRTVTLNGLSAITQSRKHMFGYDWMAMAADHAGDSWADLGRKNEYFRRAMESYGLGEKDWDRLRGTPLHTPAEGSAGLLRPTDVKNKDLGLRYLSMILAETERAVPTGSARARSVVNANIQRGTWVGEILNSGLQFKSFAMSFMASQWQAMQMELHMGPARGAAYAASLFIPLTLGGAAAVQLNNLANGKDLQPMDPTTGQGFKFWLQALFKGGGLGLVGDFIFSDLTRFGNTPADQLTGPTVTLASDALSLTVGTGQRLLTGQKTHFGRQAVQKVSRNVPLISTHPLTRAAYQRMVVDQLQYLTDPDAHKYFRDQEQKMRRETNQGYFWRRGEMAPERGPEWPAARK